MFKKILLMARLAFDSARLPASRCRQVYERGYTLPSGTYVAPHYRTSPDHSFQNNWSTYPNVNPYTGQMGTRHTPPTYRPSVPDVQCPEL